MKRTKLLTEPLALASRSQLSLWNSSLRLREQRARANRETHSLFVDYYNVEIMRESGTFGLAYVVAVKTLCVDSFH